MYNALMLNEFRAYHSGVYLSYVGGAASMEEIEAGLKEIRSARNST